MTDVASFACSIVDHNVVVLRVTVILGVVVRATVVKATVVKATVVVVVVVRVPLKIPIIIHKVAFGIRGSNIVDYTGLAFPLNRLIGGRGGGLSVELIAG
jgi:hypothetical protein